MRSSKHHLQVSPNFIAIGYSNRHLEHLKLFSSISITSEFFTRMRFLSVHTLRTTYLNGERMFFSSEAMSVCFLKR
jgi:hypothetical protein